MRETTGDRFFGPEGIVCGEHARDGLPDGGPRIMPVPGSPYRQSPQGVLMTLEKGRDSGVSEVVGEMLMIALVVILISVFSAAIGNFLPADRDPSITILVTNDTRGNVTLWHKGGDFVKSEDLSVIVSNAATRKTYRYNATFMDPSSQFRLIQPDGSKKQVFDLGSNITVWIKDPAGNETVKLVTPRTVIFSGRTGL